MKKLNNLQKVALLGEAALTMGLGPAVVNGSTQGMLTPDLNLVTTIAEQPDIMPNDPFGLSAIYRLGIPKKTDMAELSLYRTVFESNPKLSEAFEIPFEEFSRLSLRRQMLVAALAQHSILPYLRDETSGTLGYNDLEDLEMLFEVREIIPSTKGENTVVLRDGVKVNEKKFTMETGAGADEVTFLTLEKNGFGVMLPLSINSSLFHSEVGPFVSDGHTGIVYRNQPLPSIAIWGSDDNEPRWFSYLADPRLLEKNKSGDVENYLINNVFANETDDVRLGLERFVEDASIYLSDGVLLPANKYDLVPVHEDDGVTYLVITHTPSGIKLVFKSNNMRRSEIERYKNASGYVLWGTGDAEGNAVIAYTDMNDITDRSHGTFGQASIDSQRAGNLLNLNEALKAHPNIKLLNLLDYNVVDVPNPKLQSDFLSAFEEATFETDMGECIKLDGEAFGFSFNGDVLTVTSNADPETVLHFMLYPGNQSITGDIRSMRVYHDAVVTDGLDGSGLHFFRSTIIESPNGIDTQERSR